MFLHKEGAAVLLYRTPFKSRDFQSQSFSSAFEITGLGFFSDILSLKPSIIKPKDLSNFETQAISPFSQYKKERIV